MIAAIKGVATGNWGDGYEKGIMDEYRQKAMDTGTGSAGGFIVPNQFITDIIELLRAESVVIKAGATQMNDLIGSPVEIPRQTGASTAVWIGEGQKITASDLTLGQLNMTPNQLSVLVKLSNRLIMLSNPGAEALVRSDIAIQMALETDRAALRGSGAGNEPAGLINIAGIGDLDLGANGKIPDFTDMDKLSGVVEDANALRGNLAFIWNPKAKRIIRQERIAQFSAQVNGSYVMLPMTDQMMADTLGWQFFSTTQIPTNLTKGSSAANLTEIFFGNWRELLIGTWGGLQIASSNVAGDDTGGAFSSNQTWIRAIQETDIQVRHAASFAITNEAATS